MSARIVTIKDWNATHTGSLRFKKSTGFVVIGGDSVVYRKDMESADSLVTRWADLTAEQISQDLYQMLVNKTI